MTPRKFYKTTITVEVISDEVYKFDSLEQVAYDITDGGCSGMVSLVKNKTLNGKQAAKALIAHGSDPEFFELDEKGNDLEF